MTPQEFIQKWGAPDGVPGPAYSLNEEQGAQSHFLDLCELLGVSKPGSSAGYRFEEKSKVIGGHTGYADVFLPGVFAWENKAPGKNLDTALKQLLTYSLALSNPPILVVSDRLIIRIHTQFTGHPSETHEVRIGDMDQPDKLALLRRIWIAPDSFKPKITNRDITEAAAESFSSLAEGLRRRGAKANDDATITQQRANQVAHFLTQCLFCFFAEDVGLLPDRMFERLVTNRKITCDKLTQGLSDLFTAMSDGGMFGADDIPWFNGGLFKTIDVPQLSILDVTELRKAAELNWSAIDVSIFGTLFERGLDPAKRSQLGAHYTDPTTIMRIVEPVVTRPLEQQWDKTLHGLKTLLSKSTKKGDKDYRAAKNKFVEWLDKLHNYRVLDPACGSGNFLFLGLKALKDIEHRSHLDAAALGLDREADLVTGPQNVLGIELNEYAAELARVTVWIGELQWRMAHGYEFKTNPVLEPLDHIECRDALLMWHPATVIGENLATEATWPIANVVIGNPPFLGDKKMRAELGDSYTETLRKTFEKRVPGGADLVCFWFEKARNAIQTNGLGAAGLVATNSIRGGKNRKVLESICETTCIYEAWSDENWVNDGAAVRVSLVAIGAANQTPRLNGVEVEFIGADLEESSHLGNHVTAKKMASCASACLLGVQQNGPFTIDRKTACSWLAQPSLGPHISNVLRPWSNGKDITDRSSGTWIIDFGLSMPQSEAALAEQPFAHLTTHVKPMRLAGRRESRKKYWWRLGEPSPALRRALAPLSFFLATPRVSKHRIWVKLPTGVLPDIQVVVVARADDSTFGILHSRFHELWSLRMGTSLEDRPRYTPTTCFETFPFPAGLTPAETADQLTEEVSDRAIIPASLANQATKVLATDIAIAARRLIQLRDTWLNPPEWTQRVSEVIPLGLDKSPYPDRVEPKAGISEADLDMLKKRTLTNLYNQRPAWLANIHDKLDLAVAAAYGWTDYSPTMSDDEILKRLLALNLERAKDDLKIPTI